MTLAIERAERYLKQLALQPFSTEREAVHGIVSDLLQDAKRYRALRRYLHIASDEPGEWTCWLGLKCVPWRLDPGETNPDTLVDKIVAALRERDGVL